MFIALNALIPIDSFVSSQLCASNFHKAKGFRLLGGFLELLIIADDVCHKAALYAGDMKW